MATIPVDAVRLPVTIERGARGGPSYRTNVTILDGGYEVTQINWSQARWVGTIGYGIAERDSYFALIEFFRARRGKARGFLFKDWSDYSVVGGTIGTGDGVETVFQLVKVYDDTVFPYTRTITRPVNGTVTVYVAGVPTAATINYTTGTVTFSGPNTPVAAAAVTADFEFDVPMRFDTDAISVQLEWAEAGRIPNLPIIEVRE